MVVLLIDLYLSKRFSGRPLTNFPLRYGLEPDAGELPIEDLVLILEEAGS
jgi:hypothetical protein